MNKLDRSVLYVGVPLAVILAAVGIFLTGKTEHKLFQTEQKLLQITGLKAFLAPVTIDFELVTANPPVCMTSPPWAFYAYGNMVTFTTQLPDHTFTIQFPQDNPPLSDAGGAPVSTVANITKATSQGPYTLVNPYANQCPNKECYYPYTVKMDGAPCQSKNPPNNSDGIVIKGG